MRTTNIAARGGPLAALIFLLIVGLSFSAMAGERIQIEQTLEWAELEDGVAGLPEKVDLTLLVSGLGPANRFPIDCMLIIDTSSTADIASAKSFALDLINQFGQGDRIGLISYETNAQLNIPLTENRLALKTAIGDLKAEGKSALGDAMQLARRELTMVGREDAVLVEILLSDGQSNTGIAPGIEGQIAADTGIRVISVGIGSLINRSLLQTFANDTDGLFYQRPSTEALMEIKEHLDITVVASDVQIKKELPSGLRLVSSVPRASEVSTAANGITTAIWRLSELRMDQEVTFVLEIEATEVGAWANDRDLLVTYTDFRGVDGSEMFPPPNWPPLAMFKYDPVVPTTAENIVFTDLSEDTNDDGAIVKWEWKFGDAAVSTLQNPEFRFSERGTYTVQLTVTDDRGSKSIAYEQDITVGNAAPVAGFVLRDPETMVEYTQPHIGVATMFDASMSYDLDGDIELYKWDFDGDGIYDLETDSSDIEYAFAEPGKIKVTVAVVDDEGKAKTHSKTLTILSSVLAVRNVETCLPDDWTVQATTIDVSIVISVNTLLNGLSISETIPSGWTFAEVDNDGATLRKNGDTMEWLFMEKFVDDGINAQREIKYTLTSPSTINDERVQSSIRGIVGSSSPRVSLPVSGDDRVTVVKILPVPVVISRWNTTDAILEPCLLEQIAFDQIQYAVSLWLSGGEVPMSGGAIVDLLTIQDLIAYWLTGSSVHDPLP